MMKLLAALALTIGLAGCVVAPSGYGYAPAYGYAAPAYYYAAPAVSVGFGGGWRGR